MRKGTKGSGVVPTAAADDPSQTAPLRVVFEVVPVPKPRMTRSDRWRTDPRHPDPKKRQRPAVSRYWAFCDAFRAEAARLGFAFPEAGASLRFNLPMPPSWSKRKRAEMAGQPHQQRPDVDNCCKSVLDALLGEDCRVWHLGSLEKRWAERGSIEVVVHPVAWESAA